MEKEYFLIFLTEKEIFRNINKKEDFSILLENEGGGRMTDDFLSKKRTDPLETF